MQHAQLLIKNCQSGLSKKKHRHLIRIQLPISYEITHVLICIYQLHFGFLGRPRGLMDKASDFGSEDCEFESRRGRYFLAAGFDFCIQNSHEEQLNK